MAAPRHGNPTTRRDNTRRRRRQRTLAIAMLATLACAGPILAANMPHDATGPMPVAAARGGATTRSDTMFTTTSRSLIRDQWTIGSQTPDDGTLTRVHAATDTASTLAETRDKDSLPQDWNGSHDTLDTGVNTYAYGQCTWWAYERRHQLDLPSLSHAGNARDWAAAATDAGYWTDHTPREGDIVVFQPGQSGADPTYGHVAIVEQVHEDGSITISEANVNGQPGPFKRDIKGDKVSEPTYIHY